MYTDRTEASHYRLGSSQRNIVGSEDVSHTHFSRIPAHLCKFGQDLHWSRFLTLLLTETLPKAELDGLFFNIDLMSFSIKDSIQYHPQCASDVADYFLPARLLDLEAFEQSNDLRLVIFGAKNVTKECRSEPLLGQASQRPLTTTSKNLAQHVQRLLFLDLPLTLKYAVEVTLGWV